MITGRSRYKPNMAFKKTRKAADAPASRTTMTESADTPASRLGDVLVEQDVLTPEQLWQAYDAHVASEQPLATILMERRWADEAQITQAYARLYAIPYAPLDESQTPPQTEALALIPKEVALGYQALPLSVQPDPSGDGPPSLELAMVNPWDEEFLALVRQQTGCEPRPRIAGPQSLLETVARAYAPAASEPEVIPADESSDETPADEMPADETPADETPAALEPAAESVFDAQAEDEDDEETLLPAPPPRFTFADADAPSPATPRLGDILAAQGALSPNQLAQATQAHFDTGISFVEVLLIEGFADEEQIARAQAVEFGLPYASLSNWRPTSEALAAVPPALALEYQFLPLSLQRGDGGLRIAATRPWDEATRHALQERLGCALEPFLASESALQSALARAYPPVVEASAPETESAPPEAEASVPDEAVLNEAAPVTADAGEPSSAEIAVIQETGQAGEMTAADGEAATEPQTVPEGEAALESGLIAEAEVLPEAEAPPEAEADEVDEPIASVESMTEAAPEREAETDEAPPEGTVHFVNMGLTAEPPSLGGILIATNVLTAEQVQQAVYEADTLGQTVSAVIRAHSWADEEQIARAEAAQANVEFVSLSDQTPPADVLALVPYEIASYYQALPLSRGDSDGDAPFALRVAMANPGDAEVIGLMERHIGCRVVPLQAAETSLLTLVERVYNAPPPVAEPEPEPAPVEAIAEQEEPPVAEQEAETPLMEAAPETLTAAPETEVEDAVPEMAAALETSEDLAPIVEAQTEEAEEILVAPEPKAVPTEPETADEIPALVEAVAEPDAPPATEPAEVVLAESSADELVALASDTPDLTPALVPEDENTALAEALLSDQTARLGDILVALKVITSDQLAQALDEQIQTQQRLGAVLMAHGWADEEQITRARSVQFDVSYLAVANLESDPFAIQLLPYEIARQYLVLPISIQEHENEPEGRLLVAMANPWDVEVIDLVQRYARRRVEPFLASERGLRAALERAYLDDQADVHNLAMTDSIEQAGLREMELEEMTDDVDLSETLRQSDQAPVIRFVNTLFSDAVNRRASDIHIEPRKRDFQIRYRVDGQLQTVRAVPRQFLAATTSRIKIMAEMDIVERRLPLDGRIALRVDNRSIDLRVSTMPTQYGERVVMRVLDRSSVRIGLEQLGFSDHNEKAFRGLIRQPHGIILVTGPTGSGKTTTLYAALNALKSSETNILTVEDPIEYEMEGVSQSNVNEKAGLTFARQLRAILRQDPDVVLVGEIRDAETAEIAFRAALTGHLVLSTLHCNEAAGAVSRLLDMGVPPFLIASTVIGVVGQRLVRRLCPQCRREYTPDDARLAVLREMANGSGPDAAPLRLYEPVGCAQCDKMGTKGRVALHEVLVANSQLHRLTMDRAETEAIREAAIANGMIPMVVDGLQKAGQGLTTLEDVQRKVGLPGED